MRLVWVVGRVVVVVDVYSIHINVCVVESLNRLGGKNRARRSESRLSRLSARRLAAAWLNCGPRPVGLVCSPLRPGVSACPRGPATALHPPGPPAPPGPAAGRGLPLDSTIELAE